MFVLVQRQCYIPHMSSLLSKGRYELQLTKIAKNELIHCNCMYNSPFMIHVTFLICINANKFNVDTRKKETLFIHMQHLMYKIVQEYLTSTGFLIIFQWVSTRNSNGLIPTVAPKPLIKNLILICQVIDSCSSPCLLF